MAKIRSLSQFHLITKVLIAPFIIQQHCKPMYVQSYKDLFWCKCTCFQEYTAEDMPGALNDLVSFFCITGPVCRQINIMVFQVGLLCKKYLQNLSICAEYWNIFFHQRRDYWHSKSHWNIMIQSMKLCSRSKMISQINKIICQSFTKTFIPKISCCIVLIDEHLAQCFKPNELMQHLILYPLLDQVEAERSVLFCFLLPV